MRWHVPIRSRVGNTILGTLGVLYFVFAIALLAYSLLTSWGAISPVDLLIELILAAIALGGVVFASVAADNLQLRLPRDREEKRVGSDSSRRTAAAR